MSHFGADSEIAQVQYIPKATGLQINSTINNNAIQMSQHLLMRKKKAFSAKWLHKFPFFESVAHFLAQTQKKKERERAWSSATLSSYTHAQPLLPFTIIYSSFKLIVCIVLIPFKSLSEN